MGTRYRIEYRDNVRELLLTAGGRAQGSDKAYRVPHWADPWTDVEPESRDHRWAIIDNWGDPDNILDTFETFGEAEKALSVLTTKAA